MRKKAPAPVLIHYINILPEGHKIRVWVIGTWLGLEPGILIIKINEMH